MGKDFKIEMNNIVITPAIGMPANDIILFLASLRIKISLAIISTLPLSILLFKFLPGLIFTIPFILMTNSFFMDKQE